MLLLNLWRILAGVADGNPLPLTSLERAQAEALMTLLLKRKKSGHRQTIVYLEDDAVSIRDVGPRIDIVVPLTTRDTLTAVGTN